MPVPLTIIIPTIGRDTLPRTLDSIPDGVEVVVVADGDDAFDKAESLVADRDVLLVRTEQTNTVGHHQRAYGMTLATGEWLAFMDDDDVYTPDGVETILGELGEPCVHVFRMRFKDGNQVLWGEKNLVVGNVGTPMFVVPNDPARLGRWNPKRCGDFDFVNETALLHDGRVVWHEQVISVIRP